MSPATHLSCSLVLLLLVGTSMVYAQHTSTTIEILRRTCLLNQGTDLWATTIDCNAYANHYPLSSTNKPDCSFQVNAQGNLTYINLDPRKLSGTCSWLDFQVVPEEVASATSITQMYISGPQAELSGLDLSGLTSLSWLSQRTVSFTSQPIWPDRITTVQYQEQSAPVTFPQLYSSSSFTFKDSLYYGGNMTILGDSTTVQFSNCTFINPAQINAITTRDVYLNVITASSLEITVTQTVTGSAITVIDEFSVIGPVIKLIDIAASAVTVDGQFVQLIDAVTTTLTINDDVRQIHLQRVEGNLTALYLTNDLIGIDISSSLELAGELFLPQMLADLPTGADLLTTAGYPFSNSIAISQTKLSGPVLFPDGVTSMRIPNNHFVGNLPFFDQYPTTMIVLDLTNNYINLCQGYPAMGPKIPSWIPAVDVKIYPQYADVTCYCIAGNCLSGNGFPAHYQGTPALYQSVECISESPVTNTYCLLGFWSIVGNYTIESGEVLTAGKGLAVQGDLLVKTGGVLSYQLSDKPILVQGSFDLTGATSFQLNSDDQELTKLRGSEVTATVTIPLVRSDKGITGSYASIGLAHNSASGSCNKVTDSSLTVVRGSLAAIMTIDGRKCQGPGQWSKATIIGVTVGITLGIASIVVIGVLLVTYNSKVRNFIRPFSARAEERAGKV